MGTAVSVSELQPGDLVFYYSPVSHVGMYIGNGQLVHAPNPSSSVEIVSVTSMPITTARRFG
jgi:cell wall-associated NlpC family hydrolase